MTQNNRVEQFVVKPNSDGKPKYAPAFKEWMAIGKCPVCDRVFGEHSSDEFDDCLDRFFAKAKPKE